MCNLGDSRMHYRRSCPQRFVNPMFPRLATLIIHRKIGQCLFSNGICFSPQPPEGGCMSVPLMMQMLFGFQLTAAQRRLPRTNPHLFRLLRFNSQPPKGGCPAHHSDPSNQDKFQLTAAQRRLHKLAGIQPLDDVVSTHSRPKAAARQSGKPPTLSARFQLTAAQRRLPVTGTRLVAAMQKFQLTAAQRRLPRLIVGVGMAVSFNSQPPKGGCSLHQNPRKIS